MNVSPPYDPNDNLVKNIQERYSQIKPIRYTSNPNLTY